MSDNELNSFENESFSNFSEEIEGEKEKLDENIDYLQEKIEKLEENMNHLNFKINENKFKKKEKFTSKCEDLDKRIEKKLLESKKQKEIIKNNDDDYKIEKENVNLNLFKDQLAVLNAQNENLKKEIKIINETIITETFTKTSPLTQITKINKGIMTDKEVANKNQKVDIKKEIKILKKIETLKTKVHKQINEKLLKTKRTINKAKFCKQCPDFLSKGISTTQCPNHIKSKKNN